MRTRIIHAIASTRLGAAAAATTNKAVVTLVEARLGRRRPTIY
jgi:hypothetical protein